MSNQVMYYSLKAGALLAKIIPRTIGIRVLGFVGYWFGRLPTNLHKKIYRIQKVLTPDVSTRILKRRAAQVISSYAQYWWDVFYLSSKRSADDINKILTTEGDAHYEEAKSIAKERNSGIIIVLPHIGSWEIAGAWIANHGYPPVVVAERLKPPELFELFTKTRTQAGMTVIAHDDEPTKKLLQALNEEKLVCLVADRDISKRGVEVEFFRKKKTLPAGPAALALKTDSPILPICTYLSYDGSVTLAFEKPILAKDTNGESRNLEDIVQEVGKTMERQIAKDPSQWHVLSYEWSE